MSLCEYFFLLILIVTQYALVILNKFKAERCDELNDGLLCFPCLACLFILFQTQ